MIRKFIIICPSCERVFSRKEGWIRLSLSQRVYLLDKLKKQNGGIIKLACPGCSLHENATKNKEKQEDVKKNFLKNFLTKINLKINFRKKV